MRQHTLLISSIVLGGLICLAGAAQVTTVSKTFPAGETGNLYVNVQSADIRIDTGKSEVQVKALGISEADQKNLEIRQDGSSVYVDFGPREGHHNSRFEIGVPAGFNLDLKTSGGDVRIAGFLAGDLAAQTAGGDITMDDVEGKAQIKTAGGDISAGVVGSDASLKTAGGDINVTSVNGEAQAETAGGDIVIGDVGNSLSASTAGGDIKLSNVGGEATAKTAGGDVIVGDVAGSATLKTAGGDVILSSASGQVEAKTAGGDLTLKNVTGSIQGSSAGGDINAALIPSGKGPSSLSTAGGDVTLSLPATARASIKATIKVSGDWERKQKDFSIHSDFGQAEVVRDPSAREIRTEIIIGGGGEAITLDTTNGDIFIKEM